MEWRPVVGYEGIYEVSEFGDVRLLIRRGGGKHPEDGMVKIQSNRGNYKLVVLTGSDRRYRKAHKIHRIVTEAFHGEIPEGYHVNHKDADKHNNHYSNLEIVTPKENSRHAKSLGLQKILHGTEYEHAKLTEEKVREIRIRYKAGGITQYQLADEYGVVQTVIWSVVNYKTWRHVE